MKSNCLQPLTYNTSTQKVSTFGICQSHEISAVFMQFHLESNPDPLATAPTWSLNTGGNSIAPGEDLFQSKHIASLSTCKYTKAMQCQGCIVMPHAIPRSWWNLKSEHIWLRSICSCLHSMADCENCSCRWTQQALLNHLLQVDKCWSLFNFRGLPSSAETGHSRSISQNKSTVRASFSACQPPLKKTCINQCYTCPWLCQHCVSALRWSWSCFSWDIFRKRWTSSLHKIEA